VQASESSDFFCNVAGSGGSIPHQQGLANRFQGYQPLFCRTGFILKKKTSKRQGRTRAKVSPAPDKPHGEHVPYDTLVRRGLHILLGLLVLAMFPYVPDPTGDTKWHLLSWGTVILFGLTILGRGPRALPIRTPRAIVPILAAFLVVALVATLRSDHAGRSLLFLGRWAMLTALYYVVLQSVTTRRQLENLFVTVCIAFAVASCYGFLQRLGYDPFPWAERESDVYTQLPATFGNPNYAAHALALVVLMALYLTVSGRLWCAVFLPVFLVHLHLTGQRGSQVALLAAAVLITVTAVVARKITSPRRAIPVIVAITVLLGAVAAGGAMAVCKARTGTMFPLDESLLLRYNSYAGAARMILDRPVLGYGPGNYVIDNAPYWTPYEQRWFAEQRMMNEHVHNDLLEFGVEGGLLLSLIYLALFVLSIGYALLLAQTAETRKERLLGYFFSAFLTTYFVDGLFGFNVRVPVSAALLFVVLGLLEGRLPTTSVAPAPNAPRFRINARTLLAVVLVLFLVRDGLFFVSQFQLMRGRGLANAHRFEEAHAVLAKAERKAGWNWRIPYEQGRTYILEREPGKARDAFARTLTLNPNYVMTHVYLGRACMEAVIDAESKLTWIETLELENEARDHLETALNLCPTLPEAEDILGRIASTQAVRLSQRRPDPNVQSDEITSLWQQAADHFQRSLSHGARNVDTMYRLLARAYIESGQIAKGENALVKAIQASELTTKSLQEMYGMLARLQHYSRVFTTLRKKTEEAAQDPAVPEEVIGRSWEILARIAVTADLAPRDTERAFQRALHFAPHEVNLWAAYTQFARAQGDMAALYATIQDVAATASRDDPAVRVLQAVASAQDPAQGGIMEAAGTLRRTLPPDADDETIRMYGWAAGLLLEEFQSKPTDSPEAAVTLVELASVFHAIKSYQNAINLCQAAYPRLSGRDLVPCVQLWTQSWQAL